MLLRCEILIHNIQDEPEQEREALSAQFESDANKDWVCMQINGKCACEPRSRNKMKQDGSGSKEKDSHGNDIPLPAWELITLFVLMLRVSIDHVVPLALGMGAYGQQCVTNMQLLCTKCNVTKVRVVLSLAHSTLLIYFYIHRDLYSRSGSGSLVLLSS